MEPTIEVFLCYAHEDEPLRKELTIHVGGLRRQGFLNVWHDREISAGTEWAREIDAHLNTAQIILLLISQHFIASDYCYSVEMKHAMERHKRGEAYVIPIILRPVYWGRTPFAQLQALPKDAKPITGSAWHDLDEAFFNVAEGIRNVAKQLTSKPPKRKTAKSILGIPIMGSIAAGEPLDIFTEPEEEEIALLRTLEGHSNSVYSIVISPDGQTLASGSGDKTIKLWNLHTGQLLHTLEEHAESVYSVAITPNEHTLINGNGGKRNLHTGQPLHTLEEHSNYKYNGAISPDRHTLISGSGDKTIKLWNLHTGQLLRTLEGHSENVSSVAVSPDGQTLASGSWDMTVKIWGKK